MVAAVQARLPLLPRRYKRAAREHDDEQSCAATAAMEGDAVAVETLPGAVP